MCICNLLNYSVKKPDFKQMQINRQKHFLTYSASTIKRTFVQLILFRNKNKTEKKILHLGVNCI